MQLFVLSLAAAGFAVAATTMEQGDSPMPDLSKIPPCALQCLTEAVGKTSCQVTDVVCQCTTGAQAIAESSGPCLCQSDCTPEELMTALTSAEGICKAALESKGQKFDAPPASPDMCKQMQGGMPGGGSTNTSTSPTSGEGHASGGGSSPGSGYATPPSHGGNNTNATTSGGPSTSGIQQSTGAAASLEVGMPMVLSAAFLGMVGVGLMAL